MKKGTTNNPNGRPKGRPNKITRDVKSIIKNLLEEYVNEASEVNFKEDFKQLEAPDRVKVALKMTEFVVPKLNRTTIEDNTQRQREIDAVVAKLMK